MKLAPRMSVLGVALPLIGLLSAVVIASILFRRSLMADVDRRLLGQAAVESVSMFDGPNGEPHLHMLRSPLAAQVADFAPTATLVNPDGIVLLPEAQAGQPWALPRAAVPDQPVFETAGEFRTLTVGVARPKLGLYSLHLAAALAPVDATMDSFYRSVGVTVAAIALLLFAVLLMQARRIVRRIERLIALVPIIGKGELPPAVTDQRSVLGGDELGELSMVLNETARVLHFQQQAQEQFLANAAHQLRTPLAVLRTEIDLALRRPRDHAQLKEALEMAGAETNRLTLLARKLLDFESLRSHTMELGEVDVAQLISEVIARQGNAAFAKRVTLLAAPSATVQVMCDRLLVAQAIENLVDNAVRFAPCDSTVSVALGNSTERCEIVVHDDGPGIPSNERERIFEPFFHGSTPGSQTGLGLAFVADVARKHGGRVVLVPVERGTSIGLQLPRRGPSGT